MQKPTIFWNGGRNGWASFLVGFGWMPNRKTKSWSLQFYLGFWVLNLQSKDR